MRGAARVGVVSLAVLGLGSMWPHVARAQDFEWHGRIDAGRAIEVKGINGGIRALPASGGEVEVTAEIREHRRGDAEDIQFEVVEHADGVTICAMYPTPRSQRRANECAPGSEGRMNTHDIDVEVEFTVHVPANVTFVGRTVNGGVEADGLQGDVRAHTVNGDVEVSTAGEAQATTVNGSIWASMGAREWTGDVGFETVNGGITIELPEGVGADVTAHTVNGGIETDFPLTVHGRFSSRRLTGTIGGGGRRLWLETVNGSVRLVRSGR